MLIHGLMLRTIPGCGGATVTTLLKCFSTPFELKSIFSKAPADEKERIKFLHGYMKAKCQNSVNQRVIKEIIKLFDP